MLLNDWWILLTSAPAVFHLFQFFASHSLRECQVRHHTQNCRCRQTRQRSPSEIFQHTTQGFGDTVVHASFSQPSALHLSPEAAVLRRRGRWCQRTEQFNFLLAENDFSSRLFLYSRCAAFTLNISRVIWSFSCHVPFSHCHVQASSSQVCFLLFNISQSNTPSLLISFLSTPAPCPHLSHSSKNSIILPRSSSSVDLFIVKTPLAQLSAVIKNVPDVNAVV